MATFYMPCPHCSALGVDPGWVKPGCTGCLADWPDWKDYWLDSGAKGSPGAAAKAPVPDYIESGQMKADIEKLVALEVAVAVRDAIDGIHKRIADIGMAATDPGDAFDQIEEMVWTKLVEANDERNRIG